MKQTLAQKVLWLPLSKEYFLVEKDGGLTPGSVVTVALGMISTTLVRKHWLAGEVTVNKKVGE